MEVMKDRRSSDLTYIRHICEKHSYPVGALEAITRAYDAIISRSELSDRFFKWISYYEGGGELSDGICETMFSEASEIALSCDENKYTVHLLLLLLMSPHMHELYREANISDEIFYDSLKDFKWKLNECLRMHNVAGIFVAPSWSIKFFKLNLFALGRLQFEVKKAPRAFSLCGVNVCEGDTVIGVHIPSSGRLIRSEYLRSYSLAEKFFSHLSRDGKTVFICDSWLLFPEHKTMLPADSGIRMFMEDYSIITARYSSPGERPWPIFYEKKNAPADQLPQNTSLERAYVERYKRGLPTGSALGAIIYENGCIKNTERDKMV